MWTKGNCCGITENGANYCGLSKTKETAEWGSSQGKRRTVTRKRHIIQILVRNSLNSANGSGKGIWLSGNRWKLSWIKEEFSNIVDFNYFRFMNSVQIHFGLVLLLTLLCGFFTFPHSLCSAVAQFNRNRKMQFCDKMSGRRTKHGKNWPGDQKNRVTTPASSAVTQSTI